MDYLVRELSGHGVTFEDIGDSCIAKMGLENGSTATLMLPCSLITSYKAHMWHGGNVELLQTSVSEDKDGSPIIQGGVSLTFKFGNDDQIPWSSSTWALHSIGGTPQDSIEVELISTDAEDMVEVMGSVISQLTVSTPEATYAYGLEGSNFFSEPIFLSDFSIVTPELGQESRYGFGRLRDILGFRAFFPGWDARNRENIETAKGKQIESEEEMEGEETENYKHLTEKMSRIYTSAPRDFTIIDRGRRNSVVVRREGFNELYMFSPSSSHESYGMYSYIYV